MDIPNNIAALMARVLSGEASAEEIAALEAYAVQHPDVALYMDTLDKLWRKQTTDAAKVQRQSVNKRQQLQRLIDKAKAADGDALPLSTKRELLSTAQLADETPSSEPVTEDMVVTRLSFIRRYWMAAAVLLLAACGLWWLVLRQPSANSHGRDIVSNNTDVRTIAAANGSRTRTMLPDGTKVWLNAGSSLTYDHAFNGALREVTLKGEGFFEVVKNPARPFIVHAGDMNVRVLGTVFNVRSYEGDAHMETTLISGAVEVSTRYDSSHKILLKPHQKLTLQKDSTEILSDASAPATRNIQTIPHTLEAYEVKAGEENPAEIAWVYNRLVFKKETFEQLADKLGRWYNVKIVFADEAVKQLTFTGSFENETIEAAMHALQRVAISPFTYKTIANEIHVYTAK